MHLFIAGMIGITSIYKGNWKEWTKYTLTIFYVIILNLLYEILCRDKLLWEYVPGIFPKSQTVTTLLYSFIVLPGITLIFLTNYPFNETIKKQIVYISKWIIVSLITESILIYFNKLDLNNGYYFWMEPFFYVVMYSMIRLHFTRPILTYGLSFIIIILLLNIFDIPLK